MADTTTIEWTDTTWNVVTGCEKVSPGCDNCYAETFAERWRGTAGHHFETGFDVTLRPERLTLPLRWRKPRKVFVNSMSDLFHKDIPDEYIAKVWAVMALKPQHTYQILTKRHGRMRSLLNDSAFRLLCEKEQDALLGDDATPMPRYQREQKISQWWSDFAKPLRNVWLGVSVEDQKRADLRIPALLDTPAAVRFLSCEPLLGPVDLTSVDGMNVLDGGDTGHENGLHWVDGPTIHWVIAGGESGRSARPAALDWFRSLRDQCQDASVPFLFKQHGEYRGFLTTDDGYRPADLYVNREDGEARRESNVPDTGSWSGVWRLGKKRAGRELDGRTWDEFPDTHS